MGKIVIIWERGQERANYEIEGMSHVDAQFVLMAVATGNLDHALTEAHSHDHGEVEHGHEFHGHSDGG